MGGYRPGARSAPREKTNSRRYDPIKPEYIFRGGRLALVSSLRVVLLSFFARGPFIVARSVYFWDSDTSSPSISILHRAIRTFIC